MKLEPEQALALARNAARGAGASAALAEALAQATVSAEWAGKPAVGFAHLPDYLDGLCKGRINKTPVPSLSYPSPTCVRVDADGGIAQLGFDMAFEPLVARCNSHGMAVLLLNNSFTVGELGYYTRRLAEVGLIALASTNAAAQMTTADSGKPVFGTNPLSFAAPRGQEKPLVIDQASSATAFVNVRRAAENGEAMPEGWALDKNGQPTTDASAAVQGVLLPFGGKRGANIALMVEVLSAGLTGGNWSSQSPAYASGSESPAVGLFVLVLQAEQLAPGFAERLAVQLGYLTQQGVRLPGSHSNVTELDISDSVLAKVQAFI